MNIITGERIYDRRTNENLNQEELGKMISVSKSTISRWERGETAPRKNHLIRLANVLHTTVEYLIGESNNPRRPLTKKNLNSINEELFPLSKREQDIIGMLLELKQPERDVIFQIIEMYSTKKK